MKRIIFFVLIILSFAVGFWIGVISIDAPATILVRQIVTNKTVSDSHLKENAQLQIARHNFQTLKENYLKQRLEVLSKIDAQLKAVDFFKKETEKSEDEASLEASLVAEARYRNALTILSEEQDKLVSIYALELNNAYSYTDFLNKSLRK